MTNRIKHFRDKHKLTLSALSHKCGISVGHLCDIENNRCPMTAKTAQKLASVIGIKKWWKLIEEQQGKPI